MKYRDFWSRFSMDVLGAHTAKVIPLPHTHTHTHILPSPPNLLNKVDPI